MWRSTALGMVSLGLDLDHLSPATTPPVMPTPLASSESVLFHWSERPILLVEGERRRWAESSRLRGERARGAAEDKKEGQPGWRLVSRGQTWEEEVATSAHPKPGHWCKWGMLRLSQPWNRKCQQNCPGTTGRIVPAPEALLRGSVLQGMP